MVRTLSLGIVDLHYSGPGGSKPAIPAGAAADEVEYEPYGRAIRRVDLAADWDDSGSTDVADIFAFLSSWFARCSGPGEALGTCPSGQSPAAPNTLCVLPSAGCSRDARISGGAAHTTSDIFAYLSLWFATSAAATLGPADTVSDPSVANPYGYCGYYVDAETLGLLGPGGGALYHARFRVYDPAAGRWLTRDPAGFVDGMNLYGYVGGSPLGFFDPMGLVRRGCDPQNNQRKLEGQDAKYPPKQQDGEANSDFSQRQIAWWRRYHGDQSQESQASKPIEDSASRVDWSGPNTTARGAIRPELVPNPKHHPNSDSPEPPNTKELYDSSIVDKRGRWWAIDDNGFIHRFSPASQGESHWNGSTAGDRPIEGQDIPNEVNKELNKRHKEKKKERRENR